MSSEGGSFSHATYHLGADWLVRCNTYDDTTPILSFDAASSAVSITTRGTDATLAAVEFAQALASAAQKFADEMERMHAAQPSGAEGTDKAAGSHAA
jgi:hypothetical protein